MHDFEVLACVWLFFQTVDPGVGPAYGRGGSAAVPAEDARRSKSVATTQMNSGG